jgi:hypothetical protein
LPTIADMRRGRSPIIAAVLAHTPQLPTRRALWPLPPLHRALGWGAFATILAFSMANTTCFLQTHSCTGLGCFDRATLTLLTASAAWTAGTYTVDLNVDGTPATCTLVVPDPPSGRVEGTCSSGDTLVLEQEVSCTQTCGNGVCSGSCAPIPGQFHQTLTFNGTPIQVAITVSRDGRQLVQDNVRLRYVASEPNGAGCGVCHQASHDVMIAAT